jgi:hypothetical protein
MTSRFSKKLVVVVMTPLLIATLGGCVFSSKETKEVEREKGAAVVMAPASGPVVMTPGATATAPTVAPSAVPAPADRVVYQEGRWQLYGDGRTTPYYWVWIPTGATLTANPLPPARPTNSVSQRTVMYPEGRWQLYGDGRTTQYYWVWIPAGVTPPTPPLPPTG